MRTAIKTDTIRQLFALSGNECAFPGCANKLISNKGKYIGQICHIEAAADGGERYNPNMTDEERRNPENLLLLCYEHHIETDDVDEFPTSVMKKIKTDHEARFKNSPYQLPDSIAANILDEVVEKLNDIYRLSVDTNAMVRHIAAQMEKMQGAEGQMKGPRISDDSVQIAQLDTIRELKRKHKYQTAVELLEDFKQKNWETLSPELRYRVVIQLGTTYFELHQIDKACEVLLLLKDISHQTADGVAYLAYAYSLLNDHANFELWFEKGRQLQPENLNLWLAYITRHRDLPIEELKKAIPETLISTPEMIYNLGETAYNRGEIDTGIDYMLQSLNDKKLSAETLAGAKAVVASKILLAVISPFKHYFTQFTASEHELMNKAHTLLNEAWEVLGNTELAASRWYILLNRGTLHKLENKMDLARIDLETAFNLSKHINAVKNLGHLYYVQNNYDLLDALILKYSEGKQVTEQDQQVLDHLKALSLFKQGHIQDALRVVENWLDKGSDETRMESYSLVLGTLIETNETEKALAYSKKMIDAFPENIKANVIRGTVMRRSGDNGGAKIALEKAYSLITPETNAEQRYHLAAALVGIESYSRAISLLEPIADKRVYNEVTETLIWAYYNNGDFSAVKFISAPLFEKYPSVVMLAEALMNVYQDTRQQDKAIAVGEKFIQHCDPALKDHFLFKIAINAFQQSDWEKVKTTIVKISNPLALKLSQCFQLALLFIRCGLVHEGKEIAYRAVNHWYDDSNAHAKLLQLSGEAETQSVNQDAMFPSTVAIDCGVTIQSDEGTTRTHIITEGETHSDKVLRLSSNLAKVLLGKHIGEEISVDQGYGIIHKWRITEITDKHVFQLRESMGLFETKFAGSDLITLMKTSPGTAIGDLETMVKNITLHQQMTHERVKDFYDKGMLTSATIAVKLNINPVRQWLKQVGDQGWETLAYLHNETPAVAQSIQQPVVIDLTALLTCFIIEGSDLLLTNFPAKWIVSTFTVDELQAFHNELNSHTRDGLLTAGYENGHLVSQHTSKEDIERHQAQIMKIIDWCRTNATVQVSDEYQNMNRVERNRDEQMYGHSSMDTYLLAMQYNCHVLSDDGTFKNVIEHQHGVKGFSTFQMAVFIAGKITKQQFAELAEKMILHGYLYIPAQETILWSVFEKAQFTLHPRFQTAVKGLRILLPQVAAVVAVKFFRLLYTNIQLDTIRSQVVLVILNELSLRPEFPQMKGIMLLASDQLFTFLPIHLVELKQMIALAGLRNSPLE